MYIQIEFLQTLNITVLEQVITELTNSTTMNMVAELANNLTTLQQKVDTIDTATNTNTGDIDNLGKIINTFKN